MRIDVYLYESGITSSRSEAKALICDGAVSVDKRVVLKPSLDVSGYENKITVDHSKKPYVSRGGIKLEGALKHFKIDAQGALCLDIGASSGGFTDCLLQNGAKHVIALDSGSYQIADKLRNDERVTVIENFNARNLTLKDLEYSPNFVVMDVSFISATYIIPAVSECIAGGGKFICLIKPQFEVGRENIGKGGIVKDEKQRALAVNKVVDFAKEHAFRNIGVIQSQIKGGDGNVEFLALFVKDN